MTSNLAAKLAPVAGILSLVVLWQLVVLVFDPPAYLLPSVADTFGALWSTRSSLLGHVLTTLTETVVGLLAGVVFGFAVAAWLSDSAMARKVLEPVLVLSQSVPPVVFAPLLVVWLGFGILPKILIVGFVVFFPVALATLSGFDAIEPDSLTYMRSLGAGKLQTLRHLKLGAAAESLTGGLKLAVSYAVFSATVAEWIGAQSGLGVYLQRSQANFRTDQIFAAVLVIAALSVGLFSLVLAVSRRLMPWKQVL